MVTIPELVRKYSQPGPRYTSYPPVPRWSAEPPPQAWGELLQRIDDPVALYVHVPFCQSQCTYCGCNMVVSRRQEAGDRYLDALARQLQGIRHPRVRWLHLGGGTPSWLSPGQLRRLFTLLHRHCERLGGHEASVEIDPELADDARLDALADGGVTRVSLGVQSLDARVLAAVGRPQSLENLRRVATACRRKGLGGLNLDLMYGLPHQTSQTLQRTLSGALSLAPERLALFGYAHVPWMKPHQRQLDASALPGPQARAEQAEQAHETLTSAGYVAIGFDHYARPDDALAVALRSGRLGRNFMGYTPHRGLGVLGVGVSAISEIDGHFVQQEAHLGRWYRAVEAGHTPIVRHHRSTREERMLADVMTQLLCDQALDLAALEARWGRPLPDKRAALARLAPLQADGLVRLTPTRVEVTSRGRALLRVVAMAFDPVLHGTERQARYSSTV